MRIFSRFKKGWNLAIASLSMIKENPSLLVFPVFSSISLVLILASFFGGGYFLIGDQIQAILEDPTGGNILAYTLIFIYYLVNFTIVTFFNTALVHCTMKLLNEESATFQEGMSFAMSRFGKIVGWAIVSATVGLILNIIQQTGKIGELVAGLFGFAWSILTFFVVPILVYQDIGVIDTIKASGKMVKEKWGESLAGNFSLFFLYLLAIAGAMGIGYVFSMINPVFGIVVTVLLVLFSIIILSAAKTVFITAIYNQTNGMPTGRFSDELLDDVFVNKK